MDIPRCTDIQALPAQVFEKFVPAAYVFPHLGEAVLGEPAYTRHAVHAQHLHCTIVTFCRRMVQTFWGLHCGAAELTSYQAQSSSAALLPAPSAWSFIWYPGRLSWGATRAMCTFDSSCTMTFFKKRSFPAPHMAPHYCLWLSTADYCAVAHELCVL